MATRAELRLRHGTPEEFESAVWKAYGQLVVTREEAMEAIGKYREEYAAAPEQLTELLRDDQVVACDGSRDV